MNVINWQSLLLNVRSSLFTIKVVSGKLISWSSSSMLASSGEGIEYISTLSDSLETLVFNLLSIISLSESLLLLVFLFVQC